MEGNSKKYYVFFYYDNAGSGRHWFLAESYGAALKQLNEFMCKYHSDRRYTIVFEKTIDKGGF